VEVGYLPGRLAHLHAQLRWMDDLDVGAEGEHVERSGIHRIDADPGLDPALAAGDGRGAPADAHAGWPALQRGKASAARVDAILENMKDGGALSAADLAKAKASPLRILAAP